ncbi:MAG: hypothetical protein RLZZ52_184, partial [Actinomycetota bacterium]
MAELGNDEFSSRRERKLAEKKTLSKTARSFASSARERGSALVTAAQDIVAATPAPARAAAPKRTNRTMVRAAVMAVALGVMATFSLPAYAIDASD